MRRWRVGDAMSKTKHSYYTWTIDEHPNPSACFDWMREHWNPGEDRSDEYMDSLKGFCRHFDVHLADYSISATGHRGEFVKAEIINAPPTIAGIRLWKYIENNFSTYRCKHTGKTERTLAGDCPFTGMVYDESLLDPMREFMAKPDDRDWQTLIDDCIHSLTKALHCDGEYDNSDEGLRESCEANEYEFDASGAAL